MKIPKLYSILTAGLVSVAVVSEIIPAQAAIINFSFSSTSPLGISGTIAFEDSVTPLDPSIAGRPKVATYYGPIQSYSFTYGTRTFSGTPTANSDVTAIVVYNNLIDMGEGGNYDGDGIDFAIHDRTTNFSLFLRALYRDNTVLRSLSLSDISIDRAIASQAPRLDLSPGGRTTISTQLQTWAPISSSDPVRKLLVFDGSDWGSEYITTTVPEPVTILGSILGTTILGVGSALKRKRKQP